MVITSTLQATWPPMNPHQVLFDKRNALRVAEAPGEATRYAPDDLSMTLRTYWVYAYLNGKYHQRGDIYKMLYVQYALFLQHVNLFRAFHPELEWGWWARDVKYLTDASRKDLLVYFGATRQEDLLAAFAHALDMFSRDAQVACGERSMEYPHAMEQSVRAHLKRMGVLK